MTAPAPFFARLALCTGLSLWAAPHLAAGAEAETNAPARLRMGDALLIHVQGVGGGIPEYREVVDSDGRIEIPFLGFLSAAGKTVAEVAAEMADAYAAARLATNAAVQITWVSHFEPPPARANLLRVQDPRRPVPAGAPVAAPATLQSP